MAHLINNHNQVESLLGASGYRTRRNILITHAEYPCYCLAQTLWYPKRGNLMLVYDMEELFSTGLPYPNQPVSIVVVSAMLAVSWLEGRRLSNWVAWNSTTVWIFSEPPAGFWGYPKPLKGYGRGRDWCLGSVRLWRQGCMNARSVIYLGTRKPISPSN